MVRYACLAVAFSWVVPGAASAAQDLSAKPVVRDAVKKLKALTGVSAELVQEVDLLGCRFTAKGTYQRAGLGKVRTELRFTVRGSGPKLFEHELLEVCDGTTWWQKVRMPASLQYRKVDLAKLGEEVEKLKLDAQTMETFKLQRFGFGGMFGLVQGAVEFADLAIDPNSSTDKHWVVRGRVSKPVIVQMRQAFPDPKGKPRLPKRVPQICHLTIDKRTGWPVRVELATEANPVAGREKPYTIVLTTSKLRLGLTFPEKTFAFAPPAEHKDRVADITRSVVQELQVLARRRAQQRAAQAAATRRASAGKSPPATVKPAGR